jgi:sigma-B regulation protein RsbU (phosphoserine phosphatase)
VRSLDTEPGDLFCLFTDGLTEVRGPGGEEFGEARLEQLFQTHAHDDLARLEGRILESVRECGAQEDDQTLMLVRVR